VAVSTALCRYRRDGMESDVSLCSKRSDRRTDGTGSEKVAVQW
jgi:hypothetical protein